jgi:hypothetical protein
MSHNAPDVDLMSFVAHPGNQPVFVIADVEDSAIATDIRFPEWEPNVKRIQMSEVSRMFSLLSKIGVRIWDSVFPEPNSMRRPRAYFSTFK